MYGFGGGGSVRRKLRVAGTKTGIINRKRLRVSSTQRAQIYLPVDLVQKNARLFGLSNAGPEKPTTWLKPLMLFARLKVYFFRVPRSIPDPLLKRPACRMGESVLDAAMNAASPTTTPVLLMPKPRLMIPRALLAVDRCGNAFFLARKHSQISDPVAGLREG